MTKFDKNPTVIVLHEKIAVLLGEVSLSTLDSKVASLEAAKASFRQDLENAKLDRAKVVSKVVPYIATELVQSDDMGKLVVKLVSSAIFYGRCQALEELADVVVNPYASFETHLSKKPRILQRLVLTRTHVPASTTPSQKATPSSALTSQTLPPPSQVTHVAALVTKPQSPPPAQ
ncbi:hypothetical protein Tco_1341108 [Tanacetum coccineum]